MSFHVLQELYDSSALLHTPVKAVVDIQGLPVKKGNSSSSDTPSVSEARDTESAGPTADSPDVATGKGSSMCEETQDSQVCAKEILDQASPHEPQRNSSGAVRAPDSVHKVISSCSGGLHSRHVLLSGIMLFWGNSYTSQANTSASGFPTLYDANKSHLALPQTCCCNLCSRTPLPPRQQAPLTSSPQSPQQSPSPPQQTPRASRRKQLRHSKLLQSLRLVLMTKSRQALLNGTNNACHACIHSVASTVLHPSCAGHAYHECLGVPSPPSPSAMQADCSVLRCPVVYKQQPCMGCKLYVCHHCMGYLTTCSAWLLHVIHSSACLLSLTWSTSLLHIRVSLPNIDSSISQDSSEAHDSPHDSLHAGPMAASCCAVSSTYCL